jgi:hypothetical protein
LNRHFATDIRLIGSVNALCSSSVSLFLLFNQQPCDNHEVICKHSGPHEQFKAIAPLGKATLHSPPAEENGDSSFNAGTEALTFFEGWAFFVGRLGGCFFSAALGNAHKFYTSVPAMLDIVMAEESPITTVDFWYFTEGFLVTLQRGFDVCIIRGISIEHPILSDQAVGALRNVDFMAEFHRLEDLASFDQIRVSFEYRKDLLFVRHLLLIKDSSPCLINDAVPKATALRANNSETPTPC